MNAKDVARLWDELRHRDPEEKLGWILELAQDPNEESIRVLLDVLQQESWFLRDQAARVLASIGEPVVEPLIEYLNSGLWYTRSSAATALGRMANPRAVAPLVLLLKDPNRTVRDAVWDALIQLCRNELATQELAVAFQSLPDRAMRYALEGLLERDPEAAGRVLQEIGERGPRVPQEGSGAGAPAPEDQLSWDDVVGGEDDAQQAAR
ncbi:MAG: HEAT repeat domain-containing protein [Candidatus Latescibacteria bacterium]|nr:HEAT repeat domain-containing protein [Candidatus Latescibacterota bacterium]